MRIAKEAEEIQGQKKQEVMAMIEATTENRVQEL